MLKSDQTQSCFKGYFKITVTAIQIYAQKCLMGKCSIYATFWSNCYAYRCVLWKSLFWNDFFPLQVQMWSLRRMWWQDHQEQRTWSHGEMTCSGVLSRSLTSWPSYVHDDNAVATLVRPPVTLSKMGGYGYCSQTTSDSKEEEWMWGVLLASENPRKPLKPH